MAEFQLTLTDDERQYLCELLTQTLKVKQVEEHRTRVLGYRELVQREEEVLAGVLNKLVQPTPA
jgi:hypothetical protein